MTAPRKPGAPWRPLTRRAFVAALGAAAAALAVKSPGALRSLGAAAGDDHDDDLDRPRRPWTDRPRWIGHC